MKIQFSPEIKEARDYYYSVSKEDKEEKALAREVWSELSINEINRVTSKEEAIRAFRSAPWGMPAKIIALAKWAEYCTTIKELAEAYHASWKHISYRKHQNPAYEKWTAISCIEAHTAGNFEEAGIAFLDAPPYELCCGEEGSARSRAFQKWLSFCPTLKELNALEEKWLGNYLPLDVRDVFRKRYAEQYQKQTGHPYRPMSIVDF